MKTRWTFNDILEPPHGWWKAEVKCLPEKTMDWAQYWHEERHYCYQVITNTLVNINISEDNFRIGSGMHGMAAFWVYFKTREDFVMAKLAFYDI